MTVTGFRESAQVRVIHASHDTPAVDLYLGENTLAYHLTFGTRTSYVPVSEGAYTLHADLAGTRQALGVANTALVAGRQYTAIVGDSLGSLHLILLPDQNRAAPAGEAALRFVNQALRGGPMDIYVVPSGSSPLTDPLVSGMTFGTIDAYRKVPAGSYSLAVLPAGTMAGAASASLLTSPQMKLTSGSVRTIVLLDRTTSEPTNRAFVQAIVNEEGESPGAF